MTDPTLTTSNPIFIILLLIVLALLVSRALVLLGRMEGTERIHRLLPLLASILWAATIAACTFLIAGDRIELRLLLILFFLSVITFSSINWLRSLIAGIILISERRLHVGDSIHVDEHVHGEIIAMGIRTIRVRASDGTLHDIPHDILLKKPLTTHSSTGEVVCEIPFSAPPELTTAQIIALAREAASLTPLASPRHSPDVFLVDAPSHYLIRGYAFSPQYRENYRSDVLARLHDLLRPTSPLQTTPATPQSDPHLLLTE